MNLDTLMARLTSLGLPKVDEVLSCAKPATVLGLPTTGTLSFFFYVEGQPRDRERTDLLRLGL
jgi:hypothetical protein